MLQVEIPLSFIGSKHDPHFTIDRPQGNGFYVFLNFAGPVKILDKRGCRWHEHGGTIIYAPGFDQWYTAGEADMEHTWFHCTGSSVEVLLDRYDIPVNEVLGLSHVADLTPFLRSVERERLKESPFWEDIVSARAAEFFVNLGRAVAALNDVRFTAYQYEQMDVLRHVRAEVFSQLDRKWTVPEMALLGNLSASRFSSLYRLFFDHSPLDDLIEARLIKACKLLEQTNASVENIAEQCGFESLPHFSRIFRRKMDVPPSIYRKDN